MKPRKQAFYFSAAAVSAQRATILRRRCDAHELVRRDELRAISFVDALIQRIPIVSAVTDHAFREVGKVVHQFVGVALRNYTIDENTIISQQRFAQVPMLDEQDYRNVGHQPRNQIVPAEGRRAWYPQRHTLPPPFSL
jgi:hypothetical protein